tara:strand:- start:555 stop:965 length:411 start_codon:yes stop_codon:yes gene_type:complete
MANVEQIQGQIDAGIASYMPVIQRLQDTFLEENGKYWQGLFTHSSAPSDESTAAPDSLSLTPTDEEVSWSDIAGASIPSEMLSRIKIDTYNSPSGQGFVIVAEKEINGKIYRRHYNSGPVSGRDVSWHEISEDLFE